MFTSALVAYYMYQVTLPQTYREQVREVHTTQSVLTVAVQEGERTSVPSGAQRVEMMTMEFTADCAADVPITTIGLWRRGPGFTSDIDAVYIVEGGRRVSTAQTISQRNGFVQLNLQRFRIPACETKTLKVMADFSQDAHPVSEHRFVLLRGSDIDTTATVRLSKKSGGTVGTRYTSGTAVGQVSVTYLSILNTIRYGERRTLSRFLLSADGTDNQLINAITLTNEGSAHDDDLTNLYLAGSRMERLTGFVQRMDGDTVRFVFSPALEIDRNASRKIRLIGDVEAGRSQTIKFVVEEPSDVEATVKRGR